MIRNGGLLQSMKMSGVQSEAEILLSFVSRSTTQRKYAFRYVGQSGVFFDEVRFVGWKTSHEKEGNELHEKDEEKVFLKRLR